LRPETGWKMKNDFRIITFEDFTLDLGKAELRKLGTAVPVEPQVFDLIKYLCIHSEHVVTRDDLIQNVWKGRIVSDAAISTRINAARTALDDDGKGQRLIRTITRRGFRFTVKPDFETENSVIASPPLSYPEGGFSGVRYLTSFDGVHLAHETVGSGPPLIKAPNFLSHLELEHVSPVWGHWIRELSKNNTFVRCDQRGNGLSDRDVENISFDAFVRDLMQVMDALEIEKAPIMGLSQGASIAIEAAHRYPDRITGLILMGGYAAGWRKFGDPDLMRKREAMLELMHVGWGGDNPVFRQVYTNLFVPGGTSEQHEWFNDVQKASATPEMAVRILDCFGDIDVRAKLEQMDIPALVLHCREDAMVPMEAGRQMAVHMPKARFVALEGKNHILLEDDPGWPHFLREVRAFLGELEGERA